MDISEFLPFLDTASFPCFLLSIGGSYLVAVVLAPHPMSYKLQTFMLEGARSVGYVLACIVDVPFS